MSTTISRRRAPRSLVACAAGIAGLCAFAGRAGAQTPPADTLTGPQATLGGEVKDRETSAPLEGVRITVIAAADKRLVAATMTDSLGVFELPPIRPGPYKVGFERIGYGQVQRDVVLDDQVRTEFSVGMVPEAVDLEPVVVTVARRRAWFMDAFDARRSRGVGAFVTRDEIEAREPRLVSDLFRAMPGVRLVSDKYGDQHLRMRGSCVPRLYIDGVATHDMSIDLALRPVDVEAMEVYSNATVPVEYANGACGAVLVWTRPPQQQRGNSPWWRSAILIGGMLGIAVILR